MKSRNLVLIVILAAILILGGCGCTQYNSLVTNDEVVKKAWNDLQSEYQRRADLIPNLVATVKGAANFEKETYTQVALARSGQLKQALQVPVDSLTPQKVQQIQTASNEAMNAARMAINIAVERYPDLKATTNFTGLQTQLEGTENRIKVARNDYNGAVQSWNTQVRRFPVNLFAKMTGFKTREGFTATVGAERAPDVKF
jgi:LemA protein